MWPSNHWRSTAGKTDPDGARLEQVPRHGGRTDGFLDVFVTLKFQLVVLLAERQLSEEPKQRMLTLAARTSEATPLGVAHRQAVSEASHEARHEAVLQMCNDAAQKPVAAT